MDYFLRGASAFADSVWVLNLAASTRSTPSGGIADKCAKKPAKRGKSLFRRFLLVQISKLQLHQISEIAIWLTLSLSLIWSHILHYFIQIVRHAPQKLQFMAILFVQTATNRRHMQTRPFG